MRSDEISRERGLKALISYETYRNFHALLRKKINVNNYFLNSDSSIV